VSITWKIPRNCLAWLLLAQIFLLAPHVQRLPVWVLATYAVCAVWRIMVFQGRWSSPHKLVKLVLAPACFFGIFQSYGSLLGLEPTVALLFSGLSLKLLEVVNKRDVYVIIFLGYFVALTEFLFSQDFLITCLVFLSIVLVTTALVALHQQKYDQLNTESLKKSALLFLQAVPLMVVLFLVFPRFDPLWQVPISSHQNKTGVSDTLSPGDISNLTQSDKLAFRVTFEGKPPPHNKMYWRGLVMSEFDGRAWRQTDWYRRSGGHLGKRDIEQQITHPIKYSVILEATHQPWLFSLALASNDQQDILMTRDLRLVRFEDIHSRFRYDVVSDITAPLEPQIRQHDYLYETRLPNFGDPKARQFAVALRKSAIDERDYANKILAYFHREPFVYTLSPPKLGSDTIDEFLFSTRKGFCSHYASTFVFLMRSVGIAARVVTGYQGGEINPITGSVLVHQFDAHAWAEIWLENEGWVRVDPTAAVAPDRIELGAQRLMAGQDAFLSADLLSSMRFRDVAWLNQLRLQADALSYYWQSAILQYKRDQQFRALRALLGDVTPWRVASLFLGVGVLVMTLVAVNLFRGRGAKKVAPYERIYLRLCARLDRAGFKRHPQEGPIDFARRVTNDDPAWAKHLLVATRAFVTLAYEPVAKEQHKVLLKQLKRESLKISYLLHLG
jgi:protein-glutamine gamma-glutamyltransferase